MLFTPFSTSLKDPKIVSLQKINIKVHKEFDLWLRAKGLNFHVPKYVGLCISSHIRGNTSNCQNKESFYQPHGKLTRNIMMELMAESDDGDRIKMEVMACKATSNKHKVVNNET